MAEQVGSAVQGTVLRLVKLNSCGAPVTGASSAVVVTDGYIGIDPEPQYEAGDVFRTKKANGRLCINKVGPNAYANSNLGIRLCVVDADAMVLMSGGRLLTTGSPVTGTGVAYGYNNAEAHFSLETWQPLSGFAACDPVTGAQRYLYWAWPHVWNFQLGSFSIENGPLELQGTAMTNFPSSLWGQGPGSGPYWIDSAIDTTVYQDDFLHNITDTAPPTPPTVPGAFLLT